MFHNPKLIKHCFLIGVCFISEFFTSLDLSHFFSVLKSSLQILVQTAEQSPRTTDTLCALDSSFRKLAHITGSLYCMSDLIHLPLDLCQFLIFLVSIPWLARCDPPWIDLPHGFGLSVDGMARVGRSLAPVIDIESKAACLHLLAALDAAPTWRTQVFVLVLVRVCSSKDCGFYFKFRQKCLQNCDQQKYSRTQPYSHLVEMIRFLPHGHFQLEQKLSHFLCLTTPLMQCPGSTTRFWWINGDQVNLVPRYR